MGYSARRGFSSGSRKPTGAQRQAEVQQKIAQMQEAMNTAQEEVEAQGLDYDLEYVIPEEGTNVWIDSWVIPKNAPNKENAEAFINFMCREDIALKNFEYITYSTPNIAAQELIEDEEIKNSDIAFPDLTQYDNLETFHYLGAEGDELYNNLWKEVKSQ